MPSRAERAAYEAARKLPSTYDRTSFGIERRPPALKVATDAAVNALLVLLASEECRAAVDYALGRNKQFDYSASVIEAIVAWLGEEPVSPAPAPNGG